MAQLETRAQRQLGTLGGGNHFIEVCLEQGGADEGRVWLMLHSGSRNIGKELAERHIAVARRLPYNTDLPDRDLAVFLAGTPEMDAYRRDLWWAQEYARRNRAVMLALLCGVVREQFPQVRYDEPISCFAGETQVLTDQGCRPIRDLAGGRHMLLTAKGRWVKAPVASFGRQRLYEVTVGRFGEEKVIRATAEHRWLLRPKVSHNRTESTTLGLRVGDRLDYTFPRPIPNLRPSRKGVARGFVYGDGSVSGNSLAHVDFYGPKDDALLPYFDDASRLRTYHYTYGQGLANRKSHVSKRRVTEQDLASGEVKSYRRLAGLPREWKRELPSLDGPAEVLYGWIAGYFAADGDVGKTGRPSIWSADRRNLEFVKSACDVLGIWTLPIRRRVRLGFGAVDSAIYVMGISRADLTPDFFVHEIHRDRWATGRNAVERRGWTVRKVQETDVVEEVFCAIVDETHSFALEGNILTGNCHHNYVAEESYDGVDVLVTRKGAIRAGRGDLGIIPGSMGTGSYIVRGKGNPDAFCSASHGAGRRMSRAQAKRTYSTADLAAQTAGVECRKDAGVVDEIPGAYKDITQVMAQQEDLVEVVAHLKQVVCVKG